MKCLSPLTLVALCVSACGPGHPSKIPGVPDHLGDPQPPAPPIVPAPPTVRAPAVVSLVSIVSDKVEDVSSLEAWQRSFLRPDMTPEQRALAIWTSVVKFRQQDEPPNEYLGSGHPHDPIRSFNVYGYSQCDCASAATEALGRVAGFSARGFSLGDHSVAELLWDDAWHMLDGAFIDYFRAPDGTLAGVEQIRSAVTDWVQQQPSLRQDYAALRAYQASGGWHEGPPLLAACTFYDAAGNFPAGVQGWANTMFDYDRAVGFVDDFAYTLGYRVNVQLRRGERLTRNWFNLGLYVDDDDADGGDPPRALTETVGQEELVYSPAYGDLAPGRIGNGTLEYTLPIGAGELSAAALALDGLVEATADGRAILRSDGDAPGVLVVRMPSSYVYLRGTLNGEAVVAPGGQVAASLSINNGLDWIPLGVVTQSGLFTFDLTPLIRRHYDYRVRMEIAGAGSGLTAMQLMNIIQHSQRPLPALAAGDNVIQFHAGPDEGTVTVEGVTYPQVNANVAYADFHADVEGMLTGPLRIIDKSGQVTIPIATPGDMKRLRFGMHYRTRDPGDGWDYQVSFDGGQTFTSVDHVNGPNIGDSRFITYDRVPAGARAAQVRFVGTQRYDSTIFDIRVDADYAEPHGGFRPVKITYVWDEDGVPRGDVHVATHADESYVIHCDRPPHLRSLVVETAD